MILPKCGADDEYSLVVNLSEDVAIDTITLRNSEDFSENPSLYKFYGSIDYPPENWVELGSLTPPEYFKEISLKLDLEEN